MEESKSTISPRVFISYSWSSDDHTGWVRQLSKRLRNDGVDVVLDRWELRPGQDMYKFMEIIADPDTNKVIVIADCRYAQKADKRTGGVGVETQILTKEVYERVDQTKVIPVVVERDKDKKPCLPIFLRSRWHIDLSRDDHFESGYNELLHAIFDMPLDEKPPLGIPSLDRLRRPTSLVVNPLTWQTPKLTKIATGVDLAGYSKQSALTRDSRGTLTAFVRANGGRDLGFVQSDAATRIWSMPSYFQTLEDTGHLHVAATVDNADRIHAVWGRVPEASDAYYGLMQDGLWLTREIIATGTFARDIGIDSSNHPHIAWTNVDLFYTTNNGQHWASPRAIARGYWHPDVVLSNEDDVFLAVNSGGFRPTPGARVYSIDNTDGKWNAPVPVSTSPFWSGGASMAFHPNGDLFIAWIGSPTATGGSDQVFFARRVADHWQAPFQIGEVNWAATSTGQESPAIAFDNRNVFYVFWRGLTDKNRPVIFGRALGESGWSPTLTLDDPDASDVWWPTVADVRPKHRVHGVDIAWRADVGRDNVINHSHLIYPDL